MNFKKINFILIFTILFAVNLKSMVRSSLSFDADYSQEYFKKKIKKYVLKLGMLNFSLRVNTNKYNKMLDDSNNGIDMCFAFVEDQEKLEPLDKKIERLKDKISKTKRILNEWHDLYRFIYPQDFN
ncbi:MAG: hypothetical protein SZ59_C0006G0002 [candidate division TM6 bacterium GW2011_GWF2_28_16]|nr:MAG: hypothetical protein SZ59_C0006G0002 [candidate division TM6 bacterium GW2011_GWF2_28_16]